MNHPNSRAIPASEVLASRKARGHTQQQASDAMGVNLRTWQAWEYGERRMKNAFMWLYIGLYSCKNDSIT